MGIEISNIFEAFIELNKLKAYQSGQPAGLLASRTNFYKKRIKEIFDNNHEELFSYLIKTHTKLVEIEVSSSNYSHMLHDSVNFIERLISLSTKKHFIDIKESQEMDDQVHQLDNLLKD